MKPIIYWNLLTNEQRAAEVALEYGIAPVKKYWALILPGDRSPWSIEYRDEQQASRALKEWVETFETCADSEVKEFVEFPPYPTSVDACLALAREKKVILEIRLYFDGKYRVSIQSSFEKPGIYMDWSDSNLPLAESICIALLRHAGRTVDLVEGEKV